MPQPASTASKRRRTLKKILFSATAFLLSLVFCFLVFEYGFAAFYYSDIDEVEDNAFDPELGWRMKPGTYTVKAPNSLRKHQVYVNQLGLRNRDIQTKPEEGTKRLVVLGDSFVFGKAVAEEFLFTARLQEKLNAEGGKSAYEVINSGVPGYGNAQQLLLLRRLAEAGIVGDVYLLCLFTNDLLDNLGLHYANLERNAAQPCFELRADGTLALRESPRETTKSKTSPRRGSRGFKLPGIVKANLESFAQTKPGLIAFCQSLGIGVGSPRMPGVINAWYSDELLEKGLPLMKALIHEIDLEVERLGGTLLVAMLPSPIQSYPESYGPIVKSSFPDDPHVDAFLRSPWRPQQLVGDLMEELELPYLDLYQVFEPHLEHSLFIPREGHLTEFGHAVAADGLADFVRKYESGN